MSMGMDPTRLSELEQNAAYLNEIRLCHAACLDAQKNLDEKSSASKRAKLEWEQAEAGLSEVIDDAEAGEDAAFIERVREAHRVVLETLAAWNECKTQLKAAKKRLAAAEEERDEVITGGPPKPNHQMRLPFEGQSAAPTGPQLISSNHPVTVLSLHQTILSRLTDNGIQSLTTLAQLINGEHPEFAQITNVPGIDESAALAISEAFRQWQSGLSQDESAGSFEEGEGEGKAPIATKAVAQAPGESEDMGEFISIRVKDDAVVEVYDFLQVSKVYKGRLYPDGSVAISVDGSSALLEEDEYIKA